MLSIVRDAFVVAFDTGVAERAVGVLCGVELVSARWEANRSRDT
jgi:hypothetical protein